VETLATLPANECLKITRIEATPACPAGFNTNRALRFDVTASTMLPDLRWRKGAASADILVPSEGSVARNGVTTILLTDVVLGQELVVEVTSAGTVVARFTLRNY
jgi:hypothetical protein